MTGDVTGDAPGSLPSPVGTPHVLVVEDDALAGDAWRILLESTGHRVSAAQSVREAIDVLERPAATPDAMLLDLTLPDGSGLDVLARASVRPRVTLALTGHDDAAIHARCLAAGCREVLVKPIGIRELLARLGYWLGEGAP